MKNFTVDRIEEGFAVCECEDLSHISVPVENFPFEIKEGIMIRLLSDGTYERAEDEEAQMREKIIALQNRLKNKDED